MRHTTLEENFCRTVGLKFQWRQTEDAAEATRLAKASVGRDLPVLIQTDIAYLPYFNTDQRFPGHAVVICGYDDDRDEFYVSDTLRPGMLVFLNQMEAFLKPFSLFLPFGSRDRKDERK